ncbi:MAG: phosphatase PAP2 family protein [Deinococcota bacterium]
MDAIYLFQQAASPALTEVTLFMTNLGTERAYITFLLVVYLGMDARLGRYLGLTFCLGYWVNFHLKGIINTTRPYVIDPSVALTPEALATGPGPAFPSGHAQASTMFWGFLAAYYKRVWLWWVASVLIFVISLTRVYLGLHIPLDLLGGWVIGAGIIFLGLMIYQQVRQSAPWYMRLAALPKAAQIAVALVLTLLLQMLFPTADSEVMLGGAAAFAIAPFLVKYRVPKKLPAKVIIVMMGLVAAFAVLLGSSVLLPEALKRNDAVGYVRYLFIGLSGVAFVPWLAGRLGLAQPAEPLASEATEPMTSSIPAEQA